MPKSVSLILLLSLLASFVSKAQYTKDWHFTYGLNTTEEARSIVEMYDHSMVMVGYTKREDDNMYLTVVKINENGEKVWDKVFKDYYNSIGNSIITTYDHNLVFTGFCYKDGAYFSDVWVVKMDEDGNVVWEKTFGSDGDDVANCVIETSDHGYAIVGGTEANADFRTDFWLLKLDENGNKVWDQTFGGAKEDYAKCVVETSDKGLALAGYTQSKGSGDRGSNRSFWVIKTDSQGNLLWDNTYGESHFDVATSICTTPDDGLAVAGYTKSEGVVNNDILVFKLAADGTKLWSKKMGTLDTEEANCLIRTYEGNLAVAAYCKSTKIDKSNFWLITLDHETGRYIQNEKFERGSLDYSMAIIQTYDKGLVMAGSTYYFADHLGWQMAVLKFQNDNRPGISFLQPKYKETLVQHDYFSLKVVFSSATPLKQIDLFVDDKLIRTFPDFNELEFFRKSGYETTLKMNLPLHKGNNNFRIVAENQNGITKSEVYNLHNEKLPLIRW